MRLSYIISVLLLVSSINAGAATGNTSATTGGILDNEAVADADISALRAEAKLFETIKDGVVLTLAECEAAKPCALNVTEDELHQLITKLETRISTLALRRSQSGEKDLDAILLTYADVRDGYNKMLDRLSALSQTNEGKTNQNGKEDIFKDVEEDSTGAKNKKDLYNDLYDDVNDEL